MVSFLDFTTKHISELSQIKPKNYPSRSKARNATFGDWKYVKLAKDTKLSTISAELKLILALRDETVHNGTIDHFSRVYELTNRSKVESRFILMPDHDEGNICTYAGRKRFFRQDNRLNVELPSLLDRVFADTLDSLREIDKRIAPRWENPESYFNRHADIFALIETAANNGWHVNFVPPDENDASGRIKG